MYVLIFPVHFILMYDKDTMRVVKQDPIYIGRHDAKKFTARPGIRTLNLEIKSLTR